MAKRPTLSKAQRWATGATYGRATDLERVIRTKAVAINKILTQKTFKAGEGVKAITSLNQASKYTKKTGQVKLSPVTTQKGKARLKELVAQVEYYQSLEIAIKKQKSGEKGLRTTAKKYGISVATARTLIKFFRENEVLEVNSHEVLDNASRIEGSLFKKLTESELITLFNEYVDEQRAIHSYVSMRDFYKFINKINKDDSIKRLSSNDSAYDRQFKRLKILARSASQPARAAHTGRMSNKIFAPAIPPVSPTTDTGNDTGTDTGKAEIAKYKNGKPVYKMPKKF